MPASPAPSMDMQAVCKCAASRLNIPWSAVVTETTRSRYEGEKLPQATRMAKQPLPVFPELLEEVLVAPTRQEGRMSWPRKALPPTAAPPAAGHQARKKEMTV